MAKRIGFAVGLELASKRKKGRITDSELSSIFRRLDLGEVILREWGPVVFVTRTCSRGESMKTAFAEGIAEGLVHARRKERVFVKHSIRANNVLHGGKKR